MKAVLIALLCIGLGVPPALAQHGAQAAAPTNTVNPAVQAHGNFKRMAHRKDFAAKVALKDVETGPGLYGVGALADLAGEVTIHAGTVLISHGKRMDGAIHQREAGDAQATLLATARVHAWREIPVPGALKQADLHAFIVEQAQALGLDTSAAFPFLLRGEITNFRWHVVAEPNPHFAGHGGSAPMAKQYESSGARMVAEVVGFYSGAALEGVISHPDERFHEHLLDPALTRTGHLDAYDVAAGTVLLLPALR